MSFGPCESRPVKTQLKKKKNHERIFIHRVDENHCRRFLGLSGYIFEHLLRSCSHPDTLCFILKLLPVSRHVSLCVLTSSMSKSAAVIC